MTDLWIESYKSLTGNVSCFGQIILAHIFMLPGDVPFARGIGEVACLREIISIIFWFEGFQKHGLARPHITG